MVNFDTKTMYAFEKYLELQQSGELNMVSSEVQSRLGISQEEHRFIMENYAALMDEYKDLKVVDEVISDAKARVNGKTNEEMGKNFTQDNKAQEPH